MKVPHSVFLQISADKSWGRKALSLFSSASAQNQTSILAAAATFDDEGESFVNDRTIPKELEFFCEKEAVCVGGFLRAILEYQNLLAPTNNSRMLIELNSMVAVLQELNTEIELKKVELKAVKRELNAARRQRAVLRAEAENEGELVLVNMALALELLPSTVLGKIAMQEPDAVPTDWYASLPEKLTAENMKTSWAALDRVDADEELLKILKEDTPKARSMMAAAVALRSEDLPEVVQTRHFELVAASESYFELWLALEKEYHV